MQPPSRQLEEWMMICQRGTDLHPVTDVQENVDWTSSSRLYTNIAQIPSFISSNRQLATHQLLNNNADPAQLQAKQLQAYNCVHQHFVNGSTSPLHIIISGTAGTGKSYLINCLKVLLQDQLRVCAPTGVASYNIQGYTCHTLFSLPTRGDFKDLEGNRLQNLQQSLSDMNYLIIDEMSMVGRKMFGQIDRRLRQIFPHHANQMLGGRSCILFGDFGQLPPVMDLPLYTTTSRNDLSDLGSSTYHSFTKAITLDKIMRQSGQTVEQELFRNLLLRLRDGSTSISDWEELMKHTPAHVHDTSHFQNALHLFPTKDAVVQYNIDQLHNNNKPIATIKAVHNGQNASKASPDDAGGLDPVILLSVGARVMLITNLWVEVGLVNGAVGTVISIVYETGGPPDLPLAVMIRFDNYTGPTFPDQTVPIVPVRRTWHSSTGNCSRLQIPLKLAWAVTIHKAQGLTLDKVVIDIGKKEFSSGLTYVACSRVRSLEDLLFTAPFPYQRLSNLSTSNHLQQRLQEDSRLRCIEQSSITSTITTPLPVLNALPLTSVSTTSNVSTDTVSRTSMCTPSIVSMDTVSRTLLSTPSPVSVDTLSLTSMCTPSPVSMDTVSRTSMCTPSPVSTDTVSRTSMCTPSPVSVDTLSLTSMSTPSPVSVDSLSLHSLVTLSPF